MSNYRSRTATPHGAAGVPALQFPARGGTGAVAVVTVSDPGELVAAVPALLGFQPRSSLVAMALSGTSGSRLGLTLRIDLPPPEHVAEAAESVVHGLLLDDPVGAIVLVVAPGGDAGPPAAPLVERVVAELAARDVDVPLTLWTAGTEGGSRWRCYGPCDCSGVVPGGRKAARAVATLAGGRVVHADRSELERLVAPADATRIRRREALFMAELDAAADPSGEDGHGVDALDADPPDLAEEIIAGIAVLDAALDDMAAVVADGEPPAGAGAVDRMPTLDDEHVLALVRAFQVPAVRDAAIASCTGSRPAAAEALWAALTRETPDPEAAQPAALLAMSALLRGDGAVANVALDRAEAAWPGHRFSATVRGLAIAGTRPSELRALLAGDDSAFRSRRSTR